MSPVRGSAATDPRTRSVRGQGPAGAALTAKPEAPPASPMIRVLVVDDHAVVREGLRGFLALQDDVEVVGEAADGEEAVAAARALRPDVILMDLVMPNVDGVEA